MYSLNRILEFQLYYVLFLQFIKSQRLHFFKYEEFDFRFVHVFVILS